MGDGAWICPSAKSVASQGKVTNIARYDKDIAADSDPVPNAQVICKKSCELGTAPLI